MKSLVLCACVLLLAFQLSSSTELKEKLKNEEKNIENILETCLNEQGLSRNDMYKEEELMTKVHTESVNAERTRKVGCFVACAMEKLNLMDEATIKETQIHAKINELFEGRDQGIAHKIARKCLKKARSITQKCEKCFSLYVCIAESVHKLQGHEEHVREETEEIEETEEQI